MLVAFTRQQHGVTRPSQLKGAGDGGAPVEYAFKVPSLGSPNVLHRCSDLVDDCRRLLAARILGGEHAVVRVARRCLSHASTALRATFPRTAKHGDQSAGGEWPERG